MTVLDGDVDGYAGRRTVAVGDAMARAAEATSRFPLFTDPHAQVLVDASAPGELLVTQDDQTRTAARTKWFDEFFLAASAAGVAQVVILSSGLDTRAWRLPWLNDTVIFEIDTPEVLDFKRRVLDESGVTSSARWVPVPMVSSTSARRDWPKALAAVGFDHTEPTAWASERLIPELDAENSVHLLEKIDLYSARGSRIAFESRPDATADISCWLCARHWEIGSTPVGDLMTRYHRRAPGGAQDAVYVDGKKL